jgi:hypothetical protein
MHINSPLLNGNEKKLICDNNDLIYIYVWYVVESGSFIPGQTFLEFILCNCMLTLNRVILKLSIKNINIYISSPLYDILRPG